MSYLFHIAGGRRMVGPLACCLAILLATVVAPGSGSAARAQEPAPAEGATEVDAKTLDAEAEARMKALGLDNMPAKDNKAAKKAEVVDASKNPKSVLDYYWAGGPLMHPLLLMSVVVVAFAIERFMGLMRSKVLPEELVLGLGQLANRKGGLDPRLAYRLCQKHRSTAANVIRAALLKVGRPHAEVEAAVQQAAEREAELLYKNVRPITLAVSVAPLLGLLGTVLGMIKAFAVTSESTTGAKATELALGIYEALITTVAGLVVAIPAAMLAHYFEGRIQAIIRDVESLIETLLPQLERYEGKLRITRWENASDSEVEPASGASTPAPTLPSVGTTPPGAKPATNPPQPATAKG